MNKKRTILITIIVICIAALICLTYIYINNSKTFKFKNFIFNTPKNFKIKKISEDQFEITGEELDAVIEIYYNTNGEGVYKQEAMYAVLLAEAGTSIYSGTQEKVGNTEVLCFKKQQVKELLCYSNTINQFAYEILVKDSYSFSKVKEIYPILASVKWSEKPTGTNRYYEVYEKLQYEIDPESYKLEEEQ